MSLFLGLLSPGGTPLILLFHSSHLSESPLGFLDSLASPPLLELRISFPFDGFLLDVLIEIGSHIASLLAEILLPVFNAHLIGSLDLAHIKILLVPTLLAHLLGVLLHLLLLEVADSDLCLDKIVPNPGHDLITLEHLCVVVSGSIQHDSLLLKKEHRLLNVLKGNIKELDLSLNIIVHTAPLLACDILLGNNDQPLRKGGLLRSKLSKIGGLNNIQLLLKSLHIVDSVLSLIGDTQSISAGFLVRVYRY